MKAAVNRVGFDDFSTEIVNVIKLFYEQPQIEWEPIPDADWNMSIEMAENAAGTEVHVQAKLVMADGGGEWIHSHTKRLAGEGETRRGAIKRAILYSLLHVLRDVTGLDQPWGILTGVRPTKLMHNLINGDGLEAGKQLLREQYLVTEPKIELLAEVAERQLKVIPDLFQLDKEVSVYIGIPFCPTKCAYCTFPAYDIRGNNGSVGGFLEGLHYEIREMGRWLKQAGLGITTIYWGGGTPTSIEAEEMDALFQEMHEAFPAMDQVRELTVEAGRPDTITSDKLQVMRKWKVDRISINPQSFTQATLDTIGRHHTVEETVDKFELSREMGMDNINMDLIIGLPNEGVEQFANTLEKTARLLPESLTVHTLSFKRASKMTRNREDYEVAERDEIGDMMNMAADFTIKHRYKPYYLYRQKNILGNLENVGYALEGRESLYNIVMMEERQSIIGLGCGAVSKIVYPGTGEEPSSKIERFPNPKEPTAYIQNYRSYITKKIQLLDQAYFAGQHPR